MKPTYIDTGERLVKESVLLFQPDMARANLRAVKPKIVTRRLWKAGHMDVCPWGTSGDRLWGKEGYRLLPVWDCAAPSSVHQSAPIRYEADGAMRGGTVEPEPTLAFDGFGKLRPSIFMCRWMTRMEFDITETWLERLHDITDEEALLEGIEEKRSSSGSVYYSAGPDIEALTPVLAYKTLWIAINGPESWDRNPKVWRIGYRRRDA